MNRPKALLDGDIDKHEYRFSTYCEGKSCFICGKPLTDKIHQPSYPPDPQRERLVELILEELPVWQRPVVAGRIRKVIDSFKITFW